MDRYNHWLGKLFGFFNGDELYAVTFGQTSYYSCEEKYISKSWRAHEDEHKKQWARDGKVKFFTRYVYQLITKGYMNIDYEIEARKASVPFGGKE